MTKDWISHACALHSRCSVFFMLRLIIANDDNFGYETYDYNNLLWLESLDYGPVTYACMRRGFSLKYGGLYCLEVWIMDQFHTHACAVGSVHNMADCIA